MEVPTNPWNEVFKQRGRVFHNPHPDIPGIVALMKKAGVKTVLDLGSGTGRHTIYLAKNGFNVFGLDNSPEGIQATQKWLAEQGLEAELIQSNMSDPLPYEDSFFDAVISVQVMHHGNTATVHSIAREITRVTRQGGLVYITVATLKMLSNEWEEVEPNTFIPLDGPEKGLLHHFFTIEELKDTYSSFNIVDIHFDAHKHHCMTAWKK